MSDSAIRHFRICFSFCILLCGVLLAVQAPAQGTVEQVKVFGPSLKDNLEGESPERDVFVYLPPSYSKSVDKHYPVIYFLHGYGVGAHRYVNEFLHLPASVDQAIAAGAQEMIIVFPDAYTRFGGSLYSNSPTVGDWETFITHDLVAYIDAHYRTIPTRASRGLSGHSMGGYGTLRIGMKKPGIFGALYAMSSCCLINRAPGLKAVQAQNARMAKGLQPAEELNFVNILESFAAAWAPDPQNPPYYFDWPYKDGEAQPLIKDKWIANSPLVFVDQYVPALKSYRAIMLEVGDKDTLAASNKQLDEALTRLGVKHGWEMYHGDHLNHIDKRFEDKLLPFFSQHLAGQ